VHHQGRRATIAGQLAAAWNWKSAALSTALRGAVFFAANLDAGLPAAVHALVTELAFRGVLSGALGAATQWFSRRPQRGWRVATPLILLPALGHAGELLVHALAGTARLADSILASVAFSVVSTAFTLFAMRRGAMIVGAEAVSLRHDLRRLPALVGGFIAAIGRGIYHGVIRAVTLGRRTRWAL